MQTQSTWIDRIWQEFRAGNLTPLWRDVLINLHRYRSTGGVAWPAHATLAERACCSTDTVERALKMARELGLLTWVARRVRKGWRSLRSSNLYRFLTPQKPIQAAPGRRRPYARLLAARAVQGLLRGLLGGPRTNPQSAGGTVEEEQRRAHEQGIFGF